MLVSLGVLAVPLFAEKAHAQRVTLQPKEKQRMRTLCPNARTDAQIIQCGGSAVRLACMKIRDELGMLDAPNALSRQSLDMSKRFVDRCLSAVNRRPLRQGNRLIMGWQVALDDWEGANVSIIGAKAQGAKEKQNFGREALDALRQLKCGDLIDVAGRVLGNALPVHEAAKIAWNPAGTCVTQLVSGFACAIPDFFRDIGAMLVGIIGEGTRAPCNGLIRRNPGAALACSVFTYVGKGVQKLTRCVRALIRDKVLMDILISEGWKQGCNYMGGILFDVLMGFVSGGASIPASIARWASKVAGVINPSTWFRIGTKVGRNAVKIGKRTIDLSKGKVHITDVTAQYVQESMRSGTAAQECK
ncbi:MAG: hypothetical protein HYY84_17625 [Deltaproteobacteria bacterium]|nr:hypothetical protein [Deltaproteobacteria bacterium]